VWIRAFDFSRNTGSARIIPAVDHGDDIGDVSHPRVRSVLNWTILDDVLLFGWRRSNRLRRLHKRLTSSKCSRCSLSLVFTVSEWGNLFFLYFIRDWNKILLSISTVFLPSGLWHLAHFSHWRNNCDKLFKFQISFPPFFVFEKLALKFINHLL